MADPVTPPPPGQTPPPGSPSPNPTFHSLINPDGTLASGWQNSPLVPEGARGSKVLETTTTVPALLSQIVNAQKLVGADKIPIPAQDADPTAWSQVFGRLGKPEKPDGYAVPKLGAGEPTDAEKAFVGAMQQLAHKSDFTQRQWTAFMLGWNDLAKADHDGRVQREQAHLVELENQLRAEWPGSSFDLNKGLAEKALRTLASPQEFQTLTDLGILRHPAGVKLLHRMAGKLQEAEPELDGLPPTGASVQQAKEELQRIQGDMQHPYWKKAHAGHAAAVERVAALRAIMKRG